MRTEKLTDEQTAQVCRGFALLLHAGIQISESAYLLAREQEKDLFTAMGEQLDRGEHLSGFGRTEKSFTPIQTAPVCTAIPAAQARHLSAPVQSTKGPRLYLSGGCP